MFTEREFRIANEEASRRGHALGLTLQEYAGVERTTHGEDTIPPTCPPYFRARILEVRARKLGFDIPVRAAKALVAPIVRAVKAAITPKPAQKSDEQLRFDALLDIVAPSK